MDLLLTNNSCTDSGHMPNKFHSDKSFSERHRSMLIKK